MEYPPKTRLLSVIVDDEPGVMQRISMIFSRRSINIDSITVGKTETPGEARIILVYRADDRQSYLTRSLLRKIVHVHDVQEIDYDRDILRELAIIKARVFDEESKLKLMREIDESGGRVLYVGVNFLIVEISGESGKVRRFLESIDPNIKLDVVRSGLAAMAI